MTRGLPVSPCGGCAARIHAMHLMTISTAGLTTRGVLVSTSRGEGTQGVGRYAEECEVWKGN